MTVDIMDKPIYQEKILFPKILWQRPVHYYKSEAGKVLVLAGSKGTTGAAILTCEAVFRSGTGVLLLGFPESLKSFYKDILPEAMTLELPETPSHSLAKKAEAIIMDNAKACDAIIIGPGLSTNAETIQLVWELIFNIGKPIVLDADGITALVKGIEVMLSRENEDYLKEYFSKRGSELVITVRPNEAAKILGALKQDKKYNSHFIGNNKAEAARLITSYLSCTVVLKGQDTTMAQTDGLIIINRLEDSKDIMEGSSDVLSGIIGSFIAQNPSSLNEAIATAIYLHGLSVKIADRKIGDRTVIASDIIRYLPDAIRQAENE